MYRPEGPEYLIMGKDTHRTELQASGRDIGHDGAHDGNDDTIATVAAIQPNVYGEVLVDLEPINGSRAYINAMQISVTAIPEPTSLMLLALGLTAHLTARRPSRAGRTRV